jgi:hypothetical protein
MPGCKLQDRNAVYIVFIYNCVPCIIVTTGIVINSLLSETVVVKWLENVFQSVSWDTSGSVIISVIILVSNR